jgi:hypothetical protein
MSSWILEVEDKVFVTLLFSEEERTTEKESYEQILS